MIKSPRIKTNIKFYSGLDNVADRLYGFVTKVHGSWRGCRESEPIKKVVFPDAALCSDIIPGVLYSCSLIPMNSGNGFIAKTANIVKFEAKISTHCNNENGVFNVCVQFGNKKIVYDPSSKFKNRTDISSIAQELRNRVDLEQALCVAEDFINHALIVRRLYQQHTTHV